MADSIDQHKNNETIMKEDASNESNHLPCSSNDPLRRLHLRMFNSIKPSLSLTSLPPQSSNENANEKSPATERPYNSLKVESELIYLLLLFINKFLL